MKKFKFGGYLFLIIALVVALYLWLRPTRLVSDASTMVEALKNGDGDRLLEFTSANERDCSGLTADRIHQAWKILIEPLLARSQFVGKDRIDVDSNDTQAVGTYRFVTDGGDPWSLNIIANQAAGGTKTTILYPMITTQSMFDDDGHANPTLTSELALRGVQRVRPKLEAIGIRAIALGPRRCLSWDELEAKLMQGIPSKNSGR